MSGNLADSVKAARLAAGMSARELAKAARLSHSYISQLEAGVIGAPSPGVLKRLSDTLSGLNYWRMLVMAGYISRTDELGGDDSSDEFGGFDGIKPDGKNCSLAPVHDAALADRIIGALTGNCAAVRVEDSGFGSHSRNSNMKKLPVLGAIPAGEAFVVPAADCDAFGSIELPPGVKGIGPFAALSVRGDSMNGAGLLDGDVVIIDRGATARDGDVCAVQIEGGEPTLKRVHFVNGCAILAPANPAFSPIAVSMSGDEGRLAIIGRVVFSQRVY